MCCSRQRGQIWLLSKHSPGSLGKDLGDFSQQSAVLPELELYPIMMDFKQRMAHLAHSQGARIKFPSFSSSLTMRKLVLMYLIYQVHDILKDNYPNFNIRG